MQTGRIHLIEPTLELEQAYHDYLREFIEAGEDGNLYHRLEETSDVPACIRKLQDHTKGVNLPQDWVPSSAFWALSEVGELVGEIEIRHWLTPALEDFGGHIGFAVRPGQRRKGYATRMLTMVLEKARDMGLKRVLITCDPKNAGSVRAIQKNGGKLTTESVARNGRLTSRYWIDLQSKKK